MICSLPPAAKEFGRFGLANSRSLTIGALIVGVLAVVADEVAGDVAVVDWVPALAAWVPALAGVIGSEGGVLLVSWVALAVLGTDVACCVPALAAWLGAGVAGASSALAIELALTLTGLGTG